MMQHKVYGIPFRGWVLLWIIKSSKYFQPSTLLFSKSHNCKGVPPCLGVVTQRCTWVGPESFSSFGWCFVGCIKWMGYQLLSLHKTWAHAIWYFWLKNCPMKIQGPSSSLLHIVFFIWLSGVHIRPFLFQIFKKAEVATIAGIMKAYMDDIIKSHPNMDTFIQNRVVFQEFMIFWDHF